MLSKTLSDDAIEESIRGMLMFGDFGGPGKNMERRVGREFFLLDGFAGDKRETVRHARDEQDKDKPSSSDLARREDSLGEKEWQALLDVIRTAEVLIDCVVPKEAIIAKQ